MLDTILNIASAAALAFLLWNSLRAKMLRAEMDGTPMSVPSDEVREAYRRAALAEASRRAGGARLDLEVEWRGRRLVMTTRPKKGE